MGYRKPRYLILYMTRKCNMRCPYCLFRLYDGNYFSGEDMDISYAKEIISYYADYGIKELYLTAEGEPLLYEYLPELLAFSQQTTFERIHLNTNGILLHKDSDSILEHIDSLYISLDGYDRASYKKHRNADVFEEVVENIKTLVQARNRSSSRLFITIACVIYKQNLHYVEEMLRLAERLGVDRIEFFNFHPVQSTVPECTPLDTSPETIGSFEKITSATHYNFEIVLPSLLTHKTQYYCENLFNYIVIGANGDFSPCCQIPPQKIYGNFRDDPELYRKDEILRFKTEFSNARSMTCFADVCRECNGLSPQNDIFSPHERIWKTRYPLNNYDYTFDSKQIH